MVAFQEFIVLLLIFSSFIFINSSDNFQKCDRNNDHKLSYKEFKACFDHSNSGIFSKYDMKELFNLFDKNKDKEVSFLEYTAVQKNIYDALSKDPKGDKNSEKTFAVIDRNGQEKEMKYDEIENTMENVMKGMKKIDDKTLLKEEEKTLKLSETNSTTDNHIANLVKVGKYCFLILSTEMNQTQGELKGIQNASIIYHTKQPQHPSFPRYASATSSLVRKNMD
jgi:Ca2+-binding EF-hand superfamily protein